MLSMVADDGGSRDNWFRFPVSLDRNERCDGRWIGGHGGAFGLEMLKWARFRAVVREGALVREVW